MSVKYAYTPNFLYKTLYSWTFAQFFMSIKKATKNSLEYIYNFIPCDKFLEVELLDQRV